LRNILEASLTLTNVDYLTKVSDKIVNLHGTCMKRCAFVLDGNLHQLELDKTAQNNYYNPVPHLNYNEWKEKQCKKGLYIFCFDRTVTWYCIDVPSTWHDGFIFDRAMSFINLLPKKFWVLGDSAFPRISRRIERKRKKNEYLPMDNDDAEFQLALEKCCGRCRLSSE
jgi:hypothetical protein